MASPLARRAVSVLLPAPLCCRRCLMHVGWRARRQSRACRPCRCLHERSSGGWQHRSHPRGLLSVSPLGEGERGSQSRRVLLDGKKDRAPATVASEHRIEPHQRSRRFSVGLPTLQNRPPPHGQHEVVLELAYPHLTPTATTWSERGESEHVRLERRRAVAAYSLLRGAWLRGAAREAQAPVP